MKPPLNPPSAPTSELLGTPIPRSTPKKPPIRWMLVRVPTEAPIEPPMTPKERIIKPEQETVNFENVSINKKDLSEFLRFESQLPFTLHIQDGSRRL